MIINNKNTNKFNNEGLPNQYIGNTVISRLKDPGCIIDRCRKLIDILNKPDWGMKFAILPEASYHMTVITLLREIDRHTSAWP